MLDLSTSACADFNEHTPDRSDTSYRSYSGYRPFDAWSVWYLPGKLIEAREGYNDGLVSVQSAKWGQHVGTLALDHLQQVQHTHTLHTATQSRHRYYVPPPLVHLFDRGTDSSRLVGGWLFVLLCEVGLGVMHRHIELYREIVWELHRIEQRTRDEQDRRTRARERAHKGKERQRTDSRNSGSGAGGGQHSQ